MAVYPFCADLKFRFSYIKAQSAGILDVFRAFATQIDGKINEKLYG